MLKRILISIVLAQPLLFSYTTNFDEAVNLAIKNNQELKAKKLDIDKAREGVKEARAYRYGKMEINENVSNTNNAGYAFGMKLSQRQASFADFGFDQFLSSPAMMKIAGMTPGPLTQADLSNVLAVQPDKLNHPDAVTNFESKIVYELPLYTGGKLDSAKEMADLQVRANEAKYARDEKMIGLEVVKAYNGAVTAKNFIKITEDSKNIASGFIKKSQKLYNEALIRKFEVEQAKTAYKSINVKLQEAQTKFKLAIAYLQFLTGDKNIDDVGEMQHFAPSSDVLANEQENAIGKRDDYAYMDYNVKTIREKIKFDSSDSKAMVGAHVEYGFNDDSANLSFNKDYYLLAVGLKYTLFDGGINSAKRQKAMVDFKQVENYQNYMKEGIALEVKQHYENLKTENKTLEEKMEVASMSKSVLHEINEVYDNNLKFRTNMMYLLMQLETMIKAQADVAMARYNKSIAEASLKLAVGESLAK